MDSAKRSLLLKIVQEQVMPALGCTEPASVALGTATARKFISGDIESIVVTVDKNVYKNGARVTIPGTKEKGLYMAASLGAIGGDPDKGLEVLKGVSRTDLTLAKALVKQGKVIVNLDNTKKALYISSKVVTSSGYSVCTIENEHTNITSIEVNDKIIKSNKEKSKTAKEQTKSSITDIQEFSLNDFKEFADSVEVKDVAFISDAIKMNLKLAQRGLKNPENWAYILDKHLSEKGINPHKSFMHYPVILAMAAVYERMDGAKEPAMALTGSGDQGLTAVLPLVAVKRIKNLSNEKLIRSILFTYLVSIYCKSYVGVLSAVCSSGSIISAALSGGILYLLGSPIEECEMATKNTLVSTAGLVCDGAKTSCALKVETGVSTALYNAILAESNVTVPNMDGIASADVRGTVNNLSDLVNSGFKIVDEDIVKILVNSKNSQC